MHSFIHVLPPAFPSHFLLSAGVWVWWQAPAYGAYKSFVDSFFQVLILELLTWTLLKKVFNLSQHRLSFFYSSNAIKKMF